MSCGHDLYALKYEQRFTFTPTMVRLGLTLWRGFVWTPESTSALSSAASVRWWIDRAHQSINQYYPSRCSTEGPIKGREPPWQSHAASIIIARKCLYVSYWDGLIRTRVNYCSYKSQLTSKIHDTAGQLENREHSQSFTTWLQTCCIILLFMY